MNKNLRFNGLKVFSATMVKDREALGERVTSWLRKKQEEGPIEITDYVVTQSSDEQFHCIAITVFFIEGEQLDVQAHVGGGISTSAKAPSNGKGQGQAPRRLQFREPG